MENATASTSAESSYNQSIYFLNPQTDPGLIPCVGISLRSELKVLMSWKFWLTGIISSVIIVLGFIGNGMAIYLLRRPKMKSAFNQLLIALCIFDTTFLLSNIPVTERALGSKIFANLTAYTDVFGQVSFCTSVFMVVALSFERHFAICSPHAYRIHLRTTKRWKHLSMYIIPVLLLGFFFNIPKFVNLKGDVMKNALYVKINLYLRALHPLATTGFVPLIFLVILNIRICRGIRVLRRPKIQRPKRSSFSTTYGGQLADVSHSSSQNRRHFKEIRASYLAIVIVVLFVVLNLPRIIASSWEVLNTNLIIHCVEHSVRYVPSMNFYILDFVARMLMVVNSAINFLIYCAVSTPFQESFVEAICPCIKSLKPFIQFCSKKGSATVTVVQVPVQIEDEDDDDDDMIENGIEMAENQQPFRLATQATLVMLKTPDNQETLKMGRVKKDDSTMVRSSTFT